MLETHFGEKIVKLEKIVNGYVLTFFSIKTPTVSSPILLNKVLIFSLSFYTFLQLMIKYSRAVIILKISRNLSDNFFYDHHSEMDG